MKTKKEIIEMGFNEYPNEEALRVAFILAYAAGYGVKIRVDEIEKYNKKVEA